jgi:1-deoxy-D-xylulose-5-phosphate reductoisomerase
MKNVVILGSTGSIGKQALEILERFKNKFRVIGLAARSRVEVILEQAEKFKPKKILLTEENAFKEAKEKWEGEVLKGEESLMDLASLEEADIVLNALVGAVGLGATLSALRSGKRLALANKESMVAGGRLVNDLIRRGKGEIVPVDSEHSALFQCLLGEEKKGIKKLVITGSGGPFRGKKLNGLKNVSVEEALKHPRWRMGPKITIDSATLMNKGLEVIEAHFLFDIPYEKIEVLIHPQSLVHGLVEFVDGSIKAHIGPTDMRLPLEYAFSYPERFTQVVESLDLTETPLTFEPPDYANFPCLKLAIEAGKKDKGYPIALNASNEEAVYAFLRKEIGFTDIPYIIEKVAERGWEDEVSSFEEVKEIDRKARELARKIIEERR